MCVRLRLPLRPVHPRLIARLLWRHGTARCRGICEYRVFISYCSPSKKKSRADILEMENLVKIIRASLQGASITTQTVDAQAFIDIVGEMINHNPDSLY
ncbi:TraC family protein [Escherichia coli]